MTKTHLLLSMNNIRLTNAHNCFQKKAKYRYENKFTQLQTRQ